MQTIVQSAASGRVGSHQTLDAARHVRRRVVSRPTQTAQSCRSTSVPNSAVAARFPDIRRKRDIRASSDSHIADKAPIRCSRAKVSFVGSDPSPKRSSHFEVEGSMLLRPSLRHNMMPPLSPNLGRVCGTVLATDSFTPPILTLSRRSQSLREQVGLPNALHLAARLLSRGKGRYHVMS